MFIMQVMAVAAISAPVPPVAHHAASSVDVSSVDKSLLGGTWTGKFLQRDWNFSFSDADGKLQGKYIRSDGRDWHPLNEIAASKRSISFTIESKPKVSFSLEVAPSKQNLTGTVTIDGVATIPFTATRAP